MHAYLHMGSHLQKQDRQWWEASGLEAFSRQIIGGDGPCSLFKNGMALPACIGFGLAALLALGLVSVR